MRLADFRAGAERVNIQKDTTRGVTVRKVIGDFSVFSLIYEKKSSKSSLKKKRSLDISLQHKNEATYKFSKKKLLHLAEKRAGAERVNSFIPYYSRVAEMAQIYLFQEFSFL